MKEPHTYRCLTVAPGCTKYVVDNQYEFLVDEPPPSTLTSMESGCSGSTFELVPDDDE